MPRYRMVAPASYYFDIEADTEEEAIEAARELASDMSREEGTDYGPEGADGRFYVDTPTPESDVLVQDVSDDEEDE